MRRNRRRDRGPAIGLGLANLWHLYRIRLRHRLVQELLALLGLAIGVALVFSALVANTSLTGSVRQLDNGIVGQTRYQLAARGPTGFDEELLAKVQRLPGVAAAAPVLEARAVVTGPRGRESVLMIGADPRFARLGGPLLTQFTSQQLVHQRAVALTAPVARRIGLGFGGRVRVQTGLGVTDAPLGGTFHESDIGQLVHSPVMLVPLPYAQRLSGMSGRITRIFVATQPGRDRVVQRGLTALAGDRLNVRPALDDVHVFEQAATPTNQSTAMFSAFAALVGFLFALSAVLLTVPRRRQFIADLRLAGHTPAIVVQVMLFDALLLGVAGTVAGLAIGDQLSRHVLGAVPGYLVYAFPVGSQRIVAWPDVAVASAGGLVAAGIAVLAPLREIFGRRPPQYAAGGSRERRTTIVLLVGGMATLAASAALLAFEPSAAMAALVLLTCSLVLLLPLLLRQAIEAVAWLGKLFRSAVPALAVMELRSRATRTRTVTLAMTGAVAVFASVAIGGAHADLQRGLVTSAQDVDRNADVWIVFPGTSEAFAVTPFGLTPAATSAIERLSDVRSVGVYRGSFLDVGDHRAWVQAPPRAAPWPVPPRQLRSGDLRLATARLRTGGWAVLSEAIAKALHVTVGDRFVLPSPVPTPFRVAAISTNIGWPPGAIVLDADDYARAWGESAPSALQIRIAPSASAAVVAREVERTLGPAAPLAVETRAERERQHAAAARQGLTRLTQISLLVLGAAVLATATAMGAMIWQRRSGIAAMKVDGFTGAELWRGLLLESAVLLGIGCLVGAVFGLAGQALLTRALVTVTGFPVVYGMGVTTALLTVVAVVVAAVLMLAVPGYLAARVRPAPGVTT